MGSLPAAWRAAWPLACPPGSPPLAVRLPARLPRLAAWQSAWPLACPPARLAVRLAAWSLTSRNPALALPPRLQEGEASNVRELTQEFALALSALKDDVAKLTQQKDMAEATIAELTVKLQKKQVAADAAITELEKKLAQQKEKVRVGNGRGWSPAKRCARPTARLLMTPTHCP